MNFQISSVSMRYTDGAFSGVQVHFNAHDADHIINLNGYVPLTAEEYSGNESMDSLVVVVRQEVADRLLNDEPESVE